MVRVTLTLEVANFRDGGGVLIVMHDRSRMPMNPYTGGCPASPLQRGRKTMVVETSINVAHHYAYRIERLSTPYGVCYRCALFGTSTIICSRPHRARGGGVPVTCVRYQDVERRAFADQAEGAGGVIQDSSSAGEWLERR